MENSLNEFKKTERLWQRIALIAGSFSIILCVMIIVNFFQINRDDPVNTKVMDKLVERLHQDPSDEALREEIRALDLVARKAYFTSQWQIRTGGYLLLIGVAVVIIAFQVIMANRKKEPQLSEDLDKDLLLRQKITRRWIATGGSAVIITALVMAFFSHQDLQEKFSTAASPPALETAEEAVDPGATEAPEETQEPVEDYQGMVQDTLANGQVDDDSQKDSEEPEAPAEKAEIPPVSDKGGGATASNVQFANFRGPGGNGVIRQASVPVDWDGPSGRNVKWKTEIPLPGFNSPIVWGDRVFLSGAEENKREVYAINSNSGEIIWTTSVTNVPGSPAQPPEVANYTGHAAPTMATDGELVYAIFANGDLVAIDMDGKMVWSKNLGVPVNHYGYSSSLMVHKDKVIVQYDQKNLAQVIALSGSSGDESWSVKRNVKISWSSPVIVNTGSRMELITVAEPLVISYNPDTGEELWRIEGVSGEVGPSVAYADGMVFAVNDYSRLVAIKIGSTPELLWSDEEYLSDVPSPVATKDCLIIPTSYGIIACYNPRTGEKYWEHEVDNTIYASPMIVGDNVYLIDKQGVMHIFKASGEFESVGTPALGEKIVCTPAFAGGRIYLRGYDHLYCIGR
jgi:outer membrane protein assembly factor BamB